jgi:riboflavin kinase/FMN adenylyltransferase
MKLIRDLSGFPGSAKGAAVALGNFDGLHIGHQAILQVTLDKARRLGCPAAVMTFEPHPREYFNPAAATLRLMRLREKISRLRGMGFSTVYLPRFNRTLAETVAEDFVEKLLVKALGVRHVITGNNFHFGAKRGGDCAFLAEAAQKYGFGYDAVAAVHGAEGMVSSSAIRTLLAEGNVAGANCLLGHSYAIPGHVAHGDKRGRTLGFPTANIPLGKLFMPRAGVYAVRAKSSAHGELRGVANVGVRPTVGGTKPQMEVHLFDFNGSLYGEYVHVTLRRFIRDEQKFASLDALKEQITRDCAEARQDD